MLVLEWFGVAEWIDRARDNGVTLHNFSPQVRRVDSFPSEIQIWLLLLANDEEPAVLHLAREMLAHYTAHDPHGYTLFDAEDRSSVEPPSWPDLPHRARVSADFPIEVTEPGWYEFSCELTVGGSPSSVVRGSRRLYVAS